jgi:hypothetical protein
MALLLLMVSLAFGQAQLINGSRVIAGWINAGTTAGTQPAYTLTLSPALPGYVTGTCVLTTIHAANSGASTLNVNGLGAKPFKKWSNGILVDLVANDFAVGRMISACYDGTNMQVMSLGGDAPLATAPDDTIIMGNGTAWQQVAIPNCVDPNHLNYTAATNTWLCGSGGTGTGGHIIKDETTTLPAQPILTFLGAGITCANNIPNTATECVVTGTGTGLPGAAGTGIIVQNSMTPTTINRTLQVDTSQLQIANANGVAGDPLISIKQGAVLSNPVISSVNAQTGTTYTMLASDVWKLVTFSNASPIAVTLPQATTAGFTAGTVFPVRNLGPSIVIITPTTSTIDSAASLSLAANDSALIYSNGAHYVTQRMGPPLGFTAVPITRQVNSHPLSSDVIVTKADVGLSNVDNTSDATKNSATAILENKQVVPRVLSLSGGTCTVGGTCTGTVSAPNADNGDIYYHYNITGDITIPNPTATGSNPRHGQVITFMFLCDTPHSIAWGGNFSAENSLPLLPSCTGGGTYDQVATRYNTNSLKWGVIAGTRSARGVVAFNTTSTSYTLTCPADAASLCELQNTAVSTGAITVAAPTGTFFNGQQLRFRFLCTNAQSITWNAIFVNSPNVTAPANCPAGTSAFTMAGAEYSTVLSKFQIIATN